MMEKWKKRNALYFHVNQINSLDHLAPLIWKALIECPQYLTVFCDFHNWEDDYRVKHLKSFENFKYHRVNLYEKVRNKVLSNKLLISTFVKYPFIRRIHGFVAKFILLNPLFAIHRPLAVIYEWGEPFRVNYIDALHKHIPIFCLPHGTFTYLNFDLTAELRKCYESEGMLPDFTQRSFCTRYVFQTKEHMKLFTKLGISPEVAAVWGNARYSPEWFEINQRIAPNYTLPLAQRAAVKCLIFMIPSIYRVHESRVLELLEKLMQCRNVDIVLSARSDTFREIKLSFGDSVSSSKKKIANVYWEYDYPPTSLVNWCDVCLNYGSSAAIEAILQRKHVIEMPFLHENKTIFDGCELVNTAHDVDDVINTIKMYQDNLLELPSDSQLESFCRSQNLVLDSGISVATSYIKQIIRHSVHSKRSVMKKLLEVI
jgi:hypothetical protein